MEYKTKFYKLNLFPANHMKIRKFVHNKMFFFTAPENVKHVILIEHI